ncbi:MAG: dipeptidase PepE [Bacteroidales bacterium]|nr:dipeptidase PepE [Bacteroidales bacterium]
MQLLLLSNSTNQGEEYLGWPREILRQFITSNNIKSCLFVPYAGVTVNWDDYTTRVQDVFGMWGCKVESVHTVNDPVLSVSKAECIVVGGGNTFRLVQMMHETGIMAAIREKSLSGTPFIGWSAGSNVACPTLCTTNDMPIIQPSSFKTLNLVPFQINPHYLDANPEGHGGETREQRINEFQALNTDVLVVGLREATALYVDGNNMNLLGNRSMRLFAAGKEPVEFQPGNEVSFLLKD